MILYKGPSLLNGSPIVAVLTATSRNAKTGNVPQVWILPADVEPDAAVRTGADTAVCGDCPLRPSVARPGGAACYVTTHRGPLSVFRAWKRGNYPTWDGATDPTRGAYVVRIGAYGDPAAVPLDVWRGLASFGQTIIGYTHQWRDPRFIGLAGFCMASTHTDEEDTAAHAAGWRVFRTVPMDHPAAAPNARRLDTDTGRATIRCPSDKARNGAPVPCNVCKACDGGPTGASRYIAVHRTKGGTA